MAASPTIKMSERVVAPISTAELERRWAAVRAQMKSRKIDALLMQGNNDFMGGYVKYFTDLPATNGYPFTVVFPHDDLMTTVGQGPLGSDIAVPPGSDGIAGAFRSKALAVLAKQIHEDFEVRRSATGDLLHGRSGDWLLQYAPGDWGVVEELKFRQVYRPLMDQ